MSLLAITDALHGYEDSELKSPGWNHTLYAEYSKGGGATVVMARQTLTPGFTAPQEKVLRELLMAFEAFPRHATGLTFANFSIKAFESPPGHGGIAVIGAQRVIGKADHSGRGGPIWKHAVYTSAGPNHPAPVGIDEGVLTDVGLEMFARLGELDSSRGLRLASDFGRFQSADSPEREREVLVQYLQRFERLPKSPTPARLPYRFAVRRSDESQRGVLYVRWQEQQVGIEEVVRGAARLATILYYSDFPWLAVELNSEDRQRDSGSLPGWVVRFVQTEGELQNRSARVVPFDALFPTGSSDVGSSLTALATRFFLCLDCELAGARDAASEPPSGSPLVGPRLTSERGPLTLVATPSAGVGKALQTDRLGPAGAGRAASLSAQPTEHFSQGAAADALQTVRQPLTTQALPVSGPDRQDERPGETDETPGGTPAGLPLAARAEDTAPLGSLSSHVHGSEAVTEIGRSPSSLVPSSPGDTDPRPAGLRPGLVAALAGNPVPARPPLPLAEAPRAVVEAPPPWRVARRLGVGLWGTVVFCGSLTSLVQTLQCRGGAAATGAVAAGRVATGPVADPGRRPMPTVDSGDSGGRGGVEGSPNGSPPPTVGMQLAIAPPSKPGDRPESGHSKPRRELRGDKRGDSRDKSLTPASGGSSGGGSGSPATAPATPSGSPGALAGVSTDGGKGAGSPPSIPGVPVVSMSEAHPENR